MLPLSRIIRDAFRPLDTSVADEAIAAAARAHKDVRVRARALRMDVSCGNPIEAVKRFASAGGPYGTILERAFPSPQGTPTDLTRLLGKM